jgi:hypothetical protein
MTVEVYVLLYITVLSLSYAPRKRTITAVKYAIVVPIMTYKIHTHTVTSAYGNGLQDNSNDVPESSALTGTPRLETFDKKCGKCPARPRAYI